NQWHPLGSGVSGVSYPSVNAIAISGSDIFVGGVFTQAGGVSANNIARWDTLTNQWYPLGSGVDDDGHGSVYAIAISGNDVYAGGFFTQAGGLAASYIARWDTTTNQWHPLGSGSNDELDGYVYAVGTSGSDVYVGGRFTHAGGVSAN